MLSFFHSVFAKYEFMRYVVVGVLNTCLSVFVFNVLMFLSGATRGSLVTLFFVIAFAASVVHGFLWTKMWVFKNREDKAPRQLASFAGVTVATALLGTGIIHVLVNTIGAPSGIPAALWANIAMLLTIPVNLLSNFFGAKFLVFKRKDDAHVL